MTMGKKKRVWNIPKGKLHWEYISVTDMDEAIRMVETIEDAVQVYAFRDNNGDCFVVIWKYKEKAKDADQQTS